MPRARPRRRSTASSMQRMSSRYPAVGLTITTRSTPWLASVAARSSAVPHSCGCGRYAASGAYGCRCGSKTWTWASVAPAGRAGARVSGRDTLIDASRPCARPSRGRRVERLEVRGREVRCRTPRGRRRARRERSAPVGRVDADVELAAARLGARATRWRWRRIAARNASTCSGFAWSKRPRSPRTWVPSAREAAGESATAAASSGARLSPRSSSTELRGRLELLDRVGRGGERRRRRRPGRDWRAAPRGAAAQSRRPRRRARVAGREVRARAAACRPASRSRR